jgi:hypothetical protein
MGDCSFGERSDGKRHVSTTPCADATETNRGGRLKRRTQTGIGSKRHSGYERARIGEIQIRERRHVEEGAVDIIVPVEQLRANCPSPIICERWTLGAPALAARWRFSAREGRAGSPRAVSSSTRSSRLVVAAAADRRRRSFFVKLFRVLFANLVGANDGARAIGAHDADVGGRRRGASYGVVDDGSRIVQR